MNKIASIIIFICSVVMSSKVIGQNLSILPVRGFDLHFDSDGSRFVYRDSATKELCIYDLNTGNIEKTGLSSQGLIIEDFIGGSILFQNRDRVISRESYKIDQKLRRKFKNTGDTAVYASPDLRKIIVQIGSSIAYLQPVKGCDFINISLSPNKTLILFRATGNATYVSDLKGNIISKIDSAQFPTWTNNEEVLYAEMIDDGHQYISSQLFILNLRNGLRQEIKIEAEVIPLFPVSSKNAKKILFSTPNSEIYILDSKE